MPIAPGTQYALGLDYGTNSVRALLVDIANGHEVATHVFEYPTGNAGIIEDPRDPNLARQNPGDYIRGLNQSVRAILADSGINPDAIVGVGVDTTGSSPLPINAQGVPLSDLPQFAGNPHAMCWLWKDHTAHAEAAEITERAAGYPYLAKCGGTYSSEWFWSKILRCARIAPEVFAAAHTWIECCDYIVGHLTGTLPNAKRSVCAAGHKAMFSTEWGGLPAKEFLGSLHPNLPELRDRLYDAAYPGNVKSGEITAAVAAATGLREGTPVAVGAFDAHYGAVGAGIRPGTLVKIIGTSTCDIMVSGDAPVPDIPGVCGIVPGSVLPDRIGIEAGQSAVGDIFNWLVRFTGRSHDELTEGAAQLGPGQSGIIALDWHNGNRTVLVDPRLTGLIVGLTLHTTPAEVYRALIEATAFGALTIIRRIEANGVPVEDVINCGGIAERSPMTMQIYADILNRPMRISRSPQTCALGSAIFGAVVAGAYPSVESAQAAITGVKDVVYHPHPESVAIYAELFELYTELHDEFGHRDSDAVMKRLMAIRDRV